MIEQMKKQFFVSYNGRDEQWAEWIAWILEEAGYSVIIQAWDFRPGNNFALEMQNATAQAEKTIAVLSSNYLNALYTHPEWAAAFAQDPKGQKRTLIPIRVSECEIKGLWQQIVYADVVNLSEAEAKDVVLAALQERAKPTQAPGFPGVSLPPAERITPQRVDYPGAELPNNLNRARTGAVNFVGREDAMTQLHHQLQQQERIAITAVVTGMTGVGKTELALQYALYHQKKSTYPGGICWIGVQAETVGVQLLNFAKSLLGLFPPEDLNLRGQLDYCWARWQPPGDVLLILDDVHQYAEIQDYLPPQEQRFKVLITTRQHWLAASFEQLRLPVLSESAALALLESLIGASRLQAELEVGKGLCAWLGYLPLGLELVGRFLKRRNNWTLARMQQQLIDKGLQLSALQNPSGDMTAQRGVEAAFEVSWEALNQPARDLGCFLSLFALAPIPWRLVIERCLSAEDEEELEDIREDELLNLHLLQAVAGEVYQFHPLVRKFFQAKLALREDGDELKRSFCRGMVEEAKTIPQDLTKEQVEAVALSIPHIEESAIKLEQWLEEEDLIPPFVGLERFYEGQGFYEQAEPWFKQCLAVTRRRLGEEHSDVATSFNNLAELYCSQGKYKEAESLRLKCLEIEKQTLGEEHPQFATSLNNLAALYYSQGRYTEAEPLYLEALDLHKRLLGDNHPHVATSLNNLAALYYSQGRYTEAEPLHLEALDLRKRLLGDNHPHVATSLNNLALLYDSQGRYTEAEPLYLEALDLHKRLLGENHPHVALSLNNLAELYRSQGRYTEAEPLYLEALAIAEQALGENHPTTVKIRENLESLP
ncbi:tetratricopeptide repeat protein [Microcystis aeruginosa LEGE 11464]|uniref:tetratricopeptide repeat protein n=1 Tax=Microcystis aeruginosa TaxID=1126 RepID=UPI00187E14C8|nr:toll/interleukin-1 receptor domain-containing protein [Microcystis aeruginosa]MBE9089028.1 tetratricopeptide repeat protein [Microcystis aeruginosa LEGE 11464]